MKIFGRHSLTHSIFAHALAALLLFSTCIVWAPPANAQITTVFSYPGVRATYTASALALVPAASATDIFTIAGAANKVVRITRIMCSGTSTALGNSLIAVVKRSALDTGGTSTAPAITPLHSSDGTPSAAVLAYTANPGALGAIVGTPIMTGFVVTGTATAAGSSFTRDFGQISDKQPILRSAAEQLAVNLNGVSAPAGASLTCTFEWTESAT